ncbi:MAG TPA: aminotransferase class I/II-fold pyridoxal phosphate-dependent enzyme, partial [Acidimicrobiales bacterium]|nr:aminotransferase class I/II-fold pyridoxal phosphate-dependent enzyme [Acidimicrobiales bacterium]
GGFVPPPYPYDRLAVAARRAAEHEGGAVDLSVGTPCDPPPPAAVAALGASGTERGYPPSVGSAALRRSVADWVERRFGARLDPAQVAACVGTKEFVASAAWSLSLRTPGRDTVLAPAVAYPTYAMGAALARCRAVAVPERPEGGLDLGAVAEADAERALCLWVNSPANPTGALSDLAAAAAWGRGRAVPVLSDECYAEFTWAGAPATVVGSGTEGVVAVHSLSKRSNLAGVRVGAYAGDGELVEYLAEVRKHAGLMVPGPVQAAAVAAWDDDGHVEVQRRRYRRRLERLSEILRGAGLDAAVPAGAFYLWVPVPAWAVAEGRARGRGGAWVLTEALAEAGGVVVSPGEFYGDGAAGHVRVAAVQPDERIELVARRLAASGHPRLGPGAAPVAEATEAGR